MNNYVLKNIECRDDILYLKLTPKDSSKELVYFAGQYATIGFRSKSGRRSPMRCFSLTSSPLSHDLEFAIRVNGKFTSALSKLTPGSKMYVQGPFGQFVVDERADTNLVMLAGGIGITPMMAIIRTLTLKQSPLPITLLHSYRSGHDIPFRSEINQLKQANPKLRAFHFVTSDPVPDDEKAMFSGKIEASHIKQVTGGNYSNSTYFVCGPKSFMDGMTDLLIKYGVSEDRILTESFTQTSKLTFGNGYSVQKLTYAFAGALLFLLLSGVTYADLSRYAPHASADTSSSKVSGANSSEGASDSTTTSSSNDSNSSNSQQYQQPVSSVS